MKEFAILARGLYRPDQLAITYDPSLRMPTTPAIQQWMDTLWQQKLAIAQEKNIPLYDSKLFRLVHAETRHAGQQGNTTPVGAGEELSGEGFLGADHHIRRGGGGVDVGRGRLRRPGRRGKVLTPPGRGRRKRPLPLHPPPPPLRVRSRFRGDIIKYLPLRAWSGKGNEPPRLHLIFGDTSYKEYVTTREPEFARGRDRQQLSNALAVCSVVETTDGHILLDKRQGVDVYAGRYHVIGGFFERDLDTSTTTATSATSATSATNPDPFAAIRREIREETGIQAADIAQQHCLGVVYDLATPHAELCFLTRLNIPLNEVSQRVPEEDEIKQLLSLHVTEES
ncbi:MAG: NUDIX hydrolase, partial [Chloroflexi bacterium]